MMQMQQGMMPPMGQPMAQPMAQAAAAGRGGDNTVAHMTPGEMVVPGSVQRQMPPEMRAALRQAFLDAGMPPDRYIVGSTGQSVNPATGMPEFYDAEADGPGSGAGSSNAASGAAGYGGGFGESSGAGSSNAAGGAAGYGAGWGLGPALGGNGFMSESAASASQARAQNNPAVDDRSQDIDSVLGLMSSLGLANAFANPRDMMLNAFFSAIAPMPPSALNAAASTIGYGINSGLKAIGIEPAQQGVQRGGTGHPGEGHAGPTDPMVASTPTDPFGPGAQPQAPPQPAWMPAPMVQPPAIERPRVADPREMLRPLFYGS